LIDHLLLIDRHKRMRADEILLHPWILTLGKTTSIRSTQELKDKLRTKYDSKIKQYALERLTQSTDSH
jgi:hypothetical protein